MSKGIFFKCNNDHKKTYSIFFSEDNKIYLETNGSYVEARTALEELNKHPILVKRMPGMTEKKQMMEKMVAMNYKDAANFYADYQKSKGREGKLFNGEFNDK